MANTETPIQAQVLEALTRAGYWAFRVNSGSVAAHGVRYGAKNKKPGFIGYKGAPPGTPDILVILPPNGILVGVEVKCPGKKQNQNQIEWQAKAERAGVSYVVVNGGTEALVYLKEIVRRLTKTGFGEIKG